LGQYLKEYGNVKVVVPALGCGNGGLDWHVVKRMIEEELKGLECEIIVYEPEKK
jgi:hypothetical protein